MKSGCHNLASAKDGYYATNRRYYPDGKFSMELLWIPHRMSSHCMTRDREQLAECQGCTAPLDQAASPFRGVYAPISLVPASATESV